MSATNVRNGNRKMPDMGALGPYAYKSGPGQGPQGIPGMRNMRNPTAYISQISQQTNVTQSQPLIIRPWLDGWEKQYQQGSLIFVNKSNAIAPSRLCTTADLPTMNWILEKAYEKPTGNQTAKQHPMYKMKQLYDAGGNEGLEGKDGWNFHGIYRNDMDMQSSLQRLINVDVFGRAMVGNIWGKMNRGDVLGIGLKRINVDSLNTGMFVQPDGNLLPNILTGKGNTEVDEGKGVLQFVPIKNRKETLDYEENSQGIIEKYIQLGIVSHAVAKTPGQGLIKLALRSQDAFLRLPRVEILI